MCLFVGTIEGSLNISPSSGCCWIKYHFCWSICFRLGTLGRYGVKKGKICLSSLNLNVRFCSLLNSFSEELFSTTLLSIVKTLRAQTGHILCFCRVKDSQIAAWGIFLRPEMLIAMSVSSKCNEQILGSIYSLLNFLSARSRKTPHFLRSSHFTGKQH